MRVSYPAFALSCAASLCAATASAQTALGLADVLTRAREQAPQIVSARLAVAEAQGRVVGASLRQQFNPEVDFSAANRPTPTARWTELQLGAIQTFEPRGRRAARIATATAQVEQSSISIEETTRTVLRDAALLFYQALFATERLRLLTASVDLASSINEVADRRFRAGDLAVLDVNLARAALARARAQRDAGEAERIAALGDLRALLRVTDPIAVEGSLTVAPAPDAEALARAVEQRPELRVLDAAIREAEAETGLASTFQKPNYTAGLRYQREEGDHMLFGGLTLTLPVFSKGQEQSAVGTARAARLRAELEGARTRVRVELQAALAANERRAAAARVLETEALPGLDDTDALTTRSFDVGQIGLPDVLVIRRELLDTRIQYLSALLEAALARVEVDAAAGVLR
jgi:cobalt-zinc-cadmium efflux system outer membrane protein